MLVLGGVAKTPEEGRAKIEKALGDGSALDVFRKVVEAQGGDPRVCDSPGSVLPKPLTREELSLNAGRVVAIDSEALGIAALILGAGRRTKEDRIDPSAGLVVDAYLGEVIEAGGPPSVMLHHSFPQGDGRIAEARAMIENAFVIEPADRPAPPVRASRILEVIR
jgi:pyrimidine-nucleoside phosphorylase